MGTAFDFFSGRTGTFVLHDPQNHSYFIFNEEQAKKRLPPRETFDVFSTLVGLQTRDISQVADYIRTVRYGNQDTSGGIDSFWLDGPLAISALEQTEFLCNLYNEELPFEMRVMRKVKDILIVEKNDGFTYAGKSGSGKGLGWFVGFVTVKGKSYLFATNVEGGDEVNGQLARTIADQFIRDLFQLPSEFPSQRRERVILQVRPPLSGLPHTHLPDQMTGNIRELRL